MVEGIVLDIYCADVDNEAADTTPGITMATRMSPITRLIVRDLENSFDNLIGSSLFARIIYSQNAAG
jgi:hypothetical protein